MPSVNAIQTKSLTILEDQLQHETQKTCRGEHAERQECVARRQGKMRAEE